MSTQSLPPVDPAGMPPAYATELSPGQKVARAEGKLFSCWCGRCVTRSVKSAASCIGVIFAVSMRLAAAAIEDSFLLSRIFRKLDTHILAMIEQVGNTPKDYFKHFSSSLKSAIGVIHIMEIPVSINYFVSGIYKKHSVKQFYGNICFAVSNIGYGLHWLQEVGLTKIGNLVSKFSEVRLFSFVPKIVESVAFLRSTPQIQQAAASIGNLRVLGFTSKVTLISFAKTAESIAYIFGISYAIQDLIQAVRERNPCLVRVSLAELCCASALAIDGLLLVGYTSITGLGLLATASMILEVTSFYISVIFRQMLIKKAQS